MVKISDKINKLIGLYKNDEIDFTFFSDLIEVSNILFDETEIKELETFYNNEFDNFYK